MKKSILLLFTILGICASSKAENVNLPVFNREGFLENKGEIIDFDGNYASDVLFVHQSKDLDFFITQTGISYVFHQITQSGQQTTFDKQMGVPGNQINNWCRMDMVIQGAYISDKNCITENPSPGYSNFYKGSSEGILNVRSFETIRFTNIFEGIDWIIYSNENGIKYDFYLQPGADPGKIKMLYKWIKSLRLNARGDLIIEGPLGNITEKSPVAFVDDRGSDPSVSFELHDSIVGFKLTNYDPAKPLLIDPQIFWSTFIGSMNNDAFAKVNMDNVGNVLGTGYASGPNFPTVNPGGGAYFQGVNSNTSSYDNMLVKFSPSGVLLWSTFYGGSQSDQSYEILPDPFGNFFIAGYTLSNDLPTVNPGGGAYYQAVYGGLRDAFVCEFSSNGFLTWATYLGGIDEDWATQLVLDPIGNLYVTGFTTSTNFPTLNPGGGAYYDGVFGGGGGHDVFVAEFSASSMALLWSSYLGGTGDDRAMDIGINAGGELFVAGNCGNTFPLVNPGGGAYYDGVFGTGTYDIFLSRFASNHAMTWSTYIGSTGSDWAYYITGDLNNNIYLGGFSSGGAFPLLNPGGGAYYQSVYGGGSNDGILMEFDPSGILLWSTFVGGNGDDQIFCMDLDATTQKLYVTGDSPSTDFPFPVIGGCGYSQAAPAGNIDAFIIEFDISHGMLWGAFVGGNNIEYGRGVCRDANGCSYIAGISSSSTLFPTLNPGGGAYYSPATSGNLDGYITKICDCSILSSISNFTNLTCNGQCSGTASITPSGGTPPYTFSWSNSQTTSAINGLCAGTYSVVVTDASSGTVTASFTITQPPAITLTVNSTPASCSNDGSASVTSVTNGTGPFTYVWSPSGGTGQSANNLIAGSYTVSVQDALGCIATASVTVAQQSLLTASVSTSNATCFGSNNGTATVTPSGGTPPYTYAWSPSGGTNASAIGLAPGGYICTITDANGCTTSQSITITQPTQITATSTSIDATCFGSNNGTATVIPSGGTPPYTYVWSPSGGTNASATGLAPGIYSCTIADTSGCATIQNVTISEPAQLSTTISSDTATCGNNNGNAVVNVTGGTSPYVYLWSNSQSTPTAINLAGGTYTVTVTDANGCMTTASIVVASTTALTVMLQSSTSVSCFGGSDGTATVNAIGSQSPYSYSWSPTAQTSSNPTNLAAGTYTVSVTGSDGCMQTQTVLITEPSAIQVTAAATSENCNNADGSASVSVNGGMPGYTYLWSNAETTSTINNLSVGNYSVTVTDANGCTMISSTTVGASGIPNADAGISVIITAGESIQLNGSGGVTYNWSPSNNLSCSNCQNPIASPTTTTTYTLIVTDSLGCSAIDTVTIFVDIACGDIFIPNAFSPNGDHINDVLFVRGNCIKYLQFEVFNRWGEKVFVTTNPSDGWDGTWRGKDCESAVFTYLLRATSLDGSSFEKQGNISLTK